MEFITSTHHGTYAFINTAENLKGSAAGKTVLVTGSGTGIGKVY